jgi:hypothetical protein
MIMTEPDPTTEADDLLDWHPADGYLSRCLSFENYMEMLDFVVALCELTALNPYALTFEVLDPPQVSMRVAIPLGGITREFATYLGCIGDLKELHVKLPPRRVVGAPS